MRVVAKAGAGALVLDLGAAQPMRAARMVAESVESGGEAKPEEGVAGGGGIGGAEGGGGDGREGGARRLTCVEASQVQRGAREHCGAW